MEKEQINKNIHQQIFGAKYYCYTDFEKEKRPHLKNLKWLMTDDESFSKSAAVCLSVGEETEDDSTIPDYCGNIADAFAVVEEMKRREFNFELRYSPNTKKGFSARAKFVKAFQQSGGGNSHEPSFSENPEKAICLAALKAI